MSELLETHSLSIDTHQVEVPSLLEKPRFPTRRKRRILTDRSAELQAQQHQEVAQPPVVPFFDSIKQALGFGIPTTTKREEYPLAQADQDGRQSRVDTEFSALSDDEKYSFFAEVAERFRRAGSHALHVLEKTPSEQNIFEPNTIDSLDRVDAKKVTKDYEPRLLWSREHSSSESDDTDGIYDMHTDAPSSPSESSIHVMEAPKKILKMQPFPVRIKKRRPHTTTVKSSKMALWFRDHTDIHRIKEESRQYKKAIHVLKQETKSLQKKVIHTATTLRATGSRYISVNVPSIPSIKVEKIYNVGQPVLIQKVPLLRGMSEERSMKTKVSQQENNPTQHTKRESIIRIEQQYAPQTYIASSIEKEVVPTYLDTKETAVYTNVGVPHPVSEPVQYSPPHHFYTKSVHSTDDKNTTYKSIKIPRYSSRNQTQIPSYITYATVVIVMIFMIIFISL